MANEKLVTLNGLSRFKNNLDNFNKKVQIDNILKEYKIYSWVINLGPHFNQYCLGHMCSYSGYTTCDYLCVGLGDVVSLSILTGITQIRVSKYSINEQGKITSYDGIDTYTENTDLVFKKSMIIRISVRGSTSPSYALAQSAVLIKSFRKKEDIFVYPYGPWNYPKQYITTSATGITSTLTSGLNGDPYWDTVSNGFREISGHIFIYCKEGSYTLTVNLNYIYIKYGINEPSLMVSLFWKNNNIANAKIGMFSADGSADAITTSFTSMASYSNASPLGYVLSYTGDLKPLGTTKDFLIFFEMQKPDSTINFLSTKADADNLFNSVEARIGLRYNGEPVSLKRRTRENGLLYTYKGLFPFVSTQTGGQKPSCMSEYNGKLFVGCDNYGCNIVDLSDLSLIATIADNSLEHFNNSEFTDEKYDATDTYPLLLVGNGTRAYNADLGTDYIDYIKYIRFSNDLSSFSVVKKIVIPTNLCGFWGNEIALDNDNKTLWVVGYKTQSWSDPSGNSLILTSWDLTNCQIDNNGNYIPTIKTRCELPFVRALQDMTFCNGYIFALAASSTSGSIPSEFYIIDTIKQTIRRTEIAVLTPFAELETVTKIYDENSDKHYLLIGEALYASYGGVNGTYGHIYRLDTIDDD